ncbi:uncharacterized protein LOC141853721 [Brevipalpus obovatus]|uniref:uncharacterized protein LOC141853721 n=1 Tax=Brevipalpus obovatus TaxID=246614 RepID=UPI003D9F2408
MPLVMEKSFQMNIFSIFLCINLCLITQFQLSSSNLNNNHLDSAEKFAQEYDYGNLFPIYTKQISKKLGGDYWGGHHADGSKEFEKEKNFKYKGEKASKLYKHDSGDQEKGKKAKNVHKAEEFHNSNKGEGHFVKAEMDKEKKKNLKRKWDEGGSELKQFHWNRGKHFEQGHRESVSKHGEHKGKEKKKVIAGQKTYADEEQDHLKKKGLAKHSLNKFGKQYGAEQEEKKKADKYKRLEKISYDEKDYSDFEKPDHHLGKAKNYGQNKYGTDSSKYESNGFGGLDGFGEFDGSSHETDDFGDHDLDSLAKDLMARGSNNHVVKKLGELQPSPSMGELDESSLDNMRVSEENKENDQQKTDGKSGNFNSEQHDAPRESSGEVLKSDEIDPNSNGEEASESPENLNTRDSPMSSEILEQKSDDSGQMEDFDQVEVEMPKDMRSVNGLKDYFGDDFRDFV